MADRITPRDRKGSRVFVTFGLLIVGACATNAATDGAATGMSMDSAAAAPGATSPAVGAAGSAATTPPKAMTTGAAAPTMTAVAGAAAKPPASTTAAMMPAAMSGMMPAAAGGAGSSASMSPDATPSAGAAGAPSGGAAGSTASTAAAGSGGTATPSKEHEDLGMGDGSDVVTVGDSWMSYAVNGGGIETGLLAASGQRYRTYGFAGTMLLDEVIPNQYETAKRDNPDIKTVVMTGGGNDLLLTGMTAGGCGEGCKSTIDKVTDRLVKMWEEMAADGVQDVIYIEYSRGGSNAPGVNYANEVIPPKCAAAPVRCHFIDSDLFINMVLLDGVHPTADGCQKLGKAAFDLMVEKGMRR